VPRRSAEGGVASAIAGTAKKNVEAARRVDRDIGVRKVPDDAARTLKIAAPAEHVT
jgi:hypothetical protein